jgi:superfamily II DNA or RNA helicase
VAPPGCLWDPRTACFRAPAAGYAALRRALARDGHAVEDRARGYSELPAGALVKRTSRPYQDEALAAWRAAKGRGVVVLPTGAGKTHVACLAIDDRRRSTLVLAPTLDLVRQWYDVLRATFGVPVGVIGGGDYGVEALTVSTYDSAYLHMEHLGDKFGLLVFDECHHLPGPAYALAARAAVAPFRLGLTATPERADGRHAEFDELCGPIVYRKDIVDLSGGSAGYLAPYETVRLTVELGPEDRRAHDEARAVYRDFITRNGIRMSSPSGWSDFIIRSSRSDDGRRAMAAYRKQREIAFAAPAKLDYVGLLLDRHRQDRVLLFTQDNATAYALSRRLLIPIITHETRVRERSEILAGLGRGPQKGDGYGAVVTSKVLNEGVDIPTANVAVVVSGSASVREHVQRLGRILRAQAGKHALLYELVTVNTAETFTSARRRDHSAYR